MLHADFTLIDTQRHQVQRNPHGNFKDVEASRPDWREDAKWEFTKTRMPDWKPGMGGNDGGE